MKLVKVLLTMVLSFSLFGCSSSADTEAGKLVKDGVLSVGLEIGYPPFEYFDEDGTTPIGFDIDLINAIGDKLGYEVDLVNSAWDGIFDGLNSNRYDIVCSAVTYTEDRAETMAFSSGYLGNAQSIVVMSDNDAVSSFEDLDGLRVGYQAETTSDVALTQFISDNPDLDISVNEYDVVMNAYADLSSGRLDAVVSDSLVAVDYIKEDQFSLAYQGPAEEIIAIAIRKDNDELVQEINDALTELYDEGTLVELSNEWFGMDVVSSIR